MDRVVELYRSRCIKVTSPLESDCFVRFLTFVLTSFGFIIDKNKKHTVGCFPHLAPIGWFQIKVFGEAS